MGGFAVKIKRKQVRTGGVKEMVDRNGEIHSAVVIEEQELDDAHFVKVFASGVRAAFDLSLTGARVFQAMLDVYQRQPLTGGFADCIYLHFFDGGLDGRKLEMSDRTFRRGLVELLDRGFIAPKGENLFWVNANLFFRGDRATFIKSYHRRKTTGDEKDRAELENKGQQRLID